jgi:hypothetical protein
MPAEQSHDDQGGTSLSHRKPLNPQALRSFHFESSPRYLSEHVASRVSLPETNPPTADQRRRHAAHHWRSVRLHDQHGQAAEESGVKETAETLLVGAVLTVLAAATVFMMVELLK